MTRTRLSAAFLALTLNATVAFAHCQVPCGIYDDGARIAQMREDAATIKKAVGQIRQLSGRHDAGSFNQATRWVNTKEEHASRIITTVAEYFLTQKLKAPSDGGKDAREHYHMVLADHHAVMKAAMKTKQTVDAGAVAALEAAIDRMGHHYTNVAPTAQTKPSRR